MSNFIKKYYKIFTFIFVLSLFLSYNIVKAYSSPASVQMIWHDVKYNQYDSSDTFTKNTFGVAQKVYNSNTFTALTNPCPNCQIVYKLKAGVEQRGSAVTTMGHTYNLGSASVYTDDYRLEAARFDFTLLNTNTYGTWYINS